MFDLVIRRGAVCLGEETPVQCDLGIRDGVIAAISLGDLDGRDVVDAEGKMVLPGTVDPHVHIRAPGHDERETFHSGTCDAAAGGVTTIMEMPISSPPPYSKEIVESRMRLAASEAVVDVAFFGAAGMDQIDSIVPCAQSGIVAFKTFLHEAPKGREAEFVGLTAPDTPDLYEVMKKIAESGVIGAFHAENNAMIQRNIRNMTAAGRTSPKDHERSRPPICEIETTAKVLLFAEETGATVEICHISTPRAVELVNEARARGVRVIAETCPSYLFLNVDALDRFGAFAKCNPPVRSEEERSAMWKYVLDGSIDIIGSDHAPYTKEEKMKGDGNIFVPPAGFPGLGTRLPLMYTAVREKKLSLRRMIELICTNPAKAFGLYPKKGVIAPGSDADLVLIDPMRQGAISKDEMFTRCRDSALVFEGWNVYGKPERTIVRGRTVFAGGKILAEPGWGAIVRRAGS